MSTESKWSLVGDNHYVNEVGNQLEEDISALLDTITFIKIGFLILCNYNLNTL